MSGLVIPLNGEAFEARKVIYSVLHVKLFANGPNYLPRAQKAKQSMIILEIPVLENFFKVGLASNYLLKPLRADFPTPPPIIRDIITLGPETAKYT